LIYAGYCSNYDDTTGQVIAKVVAEAADNVFLENEAACLEISKKIRARRINICPSSWIASKPATAVWD